MFLMGLAIFSTGLMFSDPNIGGSSSKIQQKNTLRIEFLILEVEVFDALCRFDSGGTG
jgi:hypothetical protein